MTYFEICLDTHVVPPKRPGINILSKIKIIK
jgi:hypothetical protein